MRGLRRGPRAASRETGGGAPLIPPLWRLAAGILMVLVAWTFLLGSENGLQVRYLHAGGISMRLLLLDPARRIQRHAEAHGAAPGEGAAEAGALQEFPGVIVAHGFAGSPQLMLGYAQVLARAGYGVLLVELPGHGSSSRPLAGGELPRALDVAYRTLIEQPEIDANRIALVGHSMGAEAAIDAAVRDPQRYRATVAISPPLGPVTPVSPRNLELQAGAWEKGVLTRARGLLDRAGGASDEFDTGRARRLVTVPAATHVSILFRDASHRAVLRWLDRSLGGTDLSPSGYRDRRILWWLLHLVGVMVFATAMAPVRWRTTVEPGGPGWLRWGVFLLAPFAATLVLLLLSRVTDLSVLAGMAVGPALALWFLVAGLALFLVPFRLQAPGARHLVWGLGMFAVLWLVFGASADLVWLHWGLSGRRLWLWPVMGLACVPWFAGMEAMRRCSSGLMRAGWWLLESAVITLALLGAGTWIAGLSLIVLVVPLLPLLFALLSVISGRVNDPWAAGIGAGLFFGWLLAAAFPLLA